MGSAGRLRGQSLVLDVDPLFDRHGSHGRIVTELAVVHRQSVQD